MSPRAEGTPQGGPLSPLLSNILLDELDRQLEQRGHRFVRYADDCNVYVQSKAAGERVMGASLGAVSMEKAPAQGQPIPRARWRGHGNASFWVTASRHIARPS